MKYTKPVSEVEKFHAQDVITTSGLNPTEGEEEDL